MKRVLGLSTLLLVSSLGHADQASFSDAQKKAIQTIVHDYLVNQPEVLIEASQALQQKQQHRMQSEIQDLIKAHQKELFQGTSTTVGNPQGAVTLVEFFDYQCGHCKKMASVVNKVLKNNANLRVVYKEFPIFGEASMNLSKAALAAGMQNKYVEMHDALLQAPAHLNMKGIMAIATKLNLNMTQFKKDMEGAAVKKELEETRQLAESLHLMGTPAFIIASTPNGVYKENATKPITFIPGATSEAALTEIIKKAG